MLLLHKPAANSSPIRNSAETKNLAESLKSKKIDQMLKAQITKDCSAITLAEITNFGPRLDILGLDFLSQL
jgi:hypothetical protein